MRELEKRIGLFPRLRVLVFGDVMLDRFIYGSVSRVSPEAPVPVLRYDRAQTMPGGAGNVALNLRALGARVTLCGAVGRDAAATELRRSLRQAGVRCELHARAGQTTVKTRFISGHSQLLRMDEETTDNVGGGTLDRIGIDALVRTHDVVLISDYGKGFIDARTARRVISSCAGHGKKVLVDPKGTDWGKYAGATVVKPNLKELADVSGRTFDPRGPSFHKQLRAAAARVFKTCPTENLVVTLSQHGIAHISGTRPHAVSHLPTVAKEVFDVSGAGDTTLAALGMMLGAGADMREAMWGANLAAGIVVGKSGTATVTRDELVLMAEKETCGNGSGTERGKIVCLDEAARRVAALRREGKIIGFTNGCFDCCHRGHLDSLRQARALCDVLVVAVNSDRWIRAHKGPGRPVQDEATRAGLLAALEVVGLVVVFDDETPLRIVKRLKPDMLAKEGYTLENWPEARYALTYGARVEQLRRVAGCSTTALVEKMRT